MNLAVNCIIGIGVITYLYVSLPALRRLYNDLRNPAKPVELGHEEIKRLIAAPNATWTDAEYETVEEHIKHCYTCKVLDNQYREASGQNKD